MAAALYTTSYFYLNVLLSLSFAILRGSPLDESMYWSNKAGWTPGFTQRDQEILMFLGVIVMFKARRAHNMTDMLQSVFNFSKTANAVLFYNLDKQAAFIFGAFWVLVHFVAPLPKFKGPNKVKIYQGVELEGLLKKDRELAGKGVKTQLRMVEFYCTWSPPCQYLVPDYAAVSMRYSSDAFQFGKIDADRNSAISKMFQIDTRATSHQVPTIILFEDGKEVERRPKLFEGGAVEKCRMNQQFIEEQFTLQKRLTRTGNHRDLTKKTKII